MANEDKGAGASPAQSKLGISPLALVVPLLNMLALLGTLGVFYYTKFKHKRTLITEEGERVRLEKMSSQPDTDAIVGFIHFDPLTVNIASIPDHPKPDDGTSRQLQGKLHYATIGLSLEVRDISKKEWLETLRPAIQDHLLQLLGKKHFHELTTVQGRYILRSQILEFANQKAVKVGGPGEEGIVSNAYFSQFVIQ